MSEEALYKPSEWGKIFHSLKVDEALGAGSAGPGKSLVLLMDPMDQIASEHARCMDKHHPYHQEWGTSTGWALHLRRTMPMLALTMDRAQRIFPRVDPNATLDKQTHTWRFTSGYKYQFGHCSESNDYEGYQSSEFCAAKGTKVVMGDGTLKEIEEVAADDFVMTLEGAKRVTATWTTGVRPCVAVDVLDQGEIVGTQIHPTTHPVLCAPTDESPPARFPHTRPAAQRCRPHGYVWQDYESLLCGIPESPVERASRVDAESGFLVSDGLRLAPGQLPALSVRIVLHEQTFQKCLERPPTSTESRGRLLERARSIPTLPARAPRLASRTSLTPQEAEHELQGLRRSADSYACDASCAPLETGTPIGSLGDCSSCPGLRGGLPPLVTGIGGGSALLQGDAARRTQPSSTQDEAGSIPLHTPCTSSFYPHFYSGESRVRSEGVRISDATIRFAGWFETFDLTVDGANHYIAESGIVNAQTSVAFDELVQFEEDQYENITSRVRSSDPMLRTMLKVRSASNPFFRREGKVSLSIRDPHWVRKRFVDPHPPGGRIMKRTLKRADGSTTYKTRIYLPATLYDNPDPQFVQDYEATLLDKPAHIRNAMLYGDWYVTPGSHYGDDWDRRIHTCREFRIPSDWRIFRSMDWGFKTHGCVHWWAIDYDGNMFCIREMSFRMKKADAVAQMVKEVEKSMGIWGARGSSITGPADTQIWEERGDTGLSKVQEFSSAGVGWVRANKKSRARNSQHFLIRIKDRRAGVPGIIFFETCTDAIKTIPGIQSDPHDPDAPAEGGDDHWHDSVLYACSYASTKNVGSSRDMCKKRFADDDNDDEPDFALSTRGKYGYGSKVE